MRIFLQGYPRSSVGVKAAMAVSGLVMSGWIALHMVGNLMVFAGPELINTYGAALQRSPLIWMMRLGLLAAIGVHIAAAVHTTRRSREARPEGYQAPRTGQPRKAGTLASRSMRLGSLVIAAFLVWHIAHIYGPLHADFIPGDVHHNVIAGFRDPLVSGACIAATVTFGLHLHHGLWSTVRTLGLADFPKVKRLDGALRLLSVVVTLGFLAPVLASVAGLLG